jgi:ATP-binding cassette subfamily B protein
MLIETLALRGSSAAGYFYYAGCQKASVLLDQSKSLFTQSKCLLSPRKLADSFVAPDAFVPPSPKVQSTLCYADQSPWKDQVVTPATVDQSAAQTVYMQLKDLPLFLRYARTYWSPYWKIGVVGAAGLMAPALYRLLLFSRGLQTVVDNVAIVGGSLAIKKALSQLAVGIPVTIGMSTLGERLASRLSSRTVNDIRSDLFAHLQKLPPAFYQKARSGDLIARFSTDMEKVEEAIGKELLCGVSDIFLLCLSLGMMFSMQWQVALLSLVPLVVLSPVILRTAGRFATTGYEKQTQKAFTMNAVREGLLARPLTEGFGLQKFTQACFGDELKKLEDKNTEGFFGRALFNISIVATYLSIEFAALAGCVLFVFSGAMSVGTLMAFVTINQTFYLNFVQLTNTRLSNFIDASVGVRRLHEIFQQEIILIDAEGAIDLPPFRKAIHFEEVAFSYHENGTSPQLENLNLEIKAGQFVAFVGASGAGKSTVFNLMMRFYDVSAGCITIDGHDLREITQDTLRAQMGVVHQDTFVFNTTIYDNIRIVKPDATQAEVIAAAKAAELHEFIVDLPDGYESSVGEAGGQLSGGQKQRIGIARALLCQPAILLLDEATSNLDTETAAAINETLQHLSKQCTIIMITHYLPAVVNADTIFVLKGGGLVEQGTHLELLAHGEVYQQLWRAAQHHGKNGETNSEVLLLGQ